MLRAAVLVVGLVVLLSPLGVGAPATVLGDAGGDDAGATRETAAPLAYGAYVANLTPGDSDWFAFASTTGLSCLDVTVLSPAPLRVALESGSAVALSARPDAEGAFGTTLASAGAGALVGFLPDEEPWDKFSVGTYRFEVVRTSPTATSDASSGGDAGNTFASGDDAPSECFRGRFRSDGPDVDVWRFAAQAGEVATVALAGAGAVRVEDATGAALSEWLLAGGATSVAIPANGTYALRAAGPVTSSGIPYGLSIHLAADPGNGCRPYCLESIVSPS